MRLPDWNDRLQALIRERRLTPFDWGTHDCVLWSADCVLAVTGVDLGSGHRGTYSTASGAVRRLRRLGFASTADLADRHLGERTHRAMARLGDIVALPDGGGMGPALGVCYGATSLFVGSTAESHGLVVVDTRDAEHCYRT